MANNTITLLHGHDLRVFSFPGTGARVLKTVQPTGGIGASDLDETKLLYVDGVVRLDDRSLAPAELKVVSLEDGRVLFTTELSERYSHSGNFVVGANMVAINRSATTPDGKGIRYIDGDLQTAPLVAPEDDPAVAVPALFRALHLRAEPDGTIVVGEAWGPL